MPDADDNALLAARSVGRRQPGGSSWLLRDVDLRIEEGDRIAVIGPTGSGKTLLMRALTRLDAIDEGQILWKGQPVNGEAIPPFRRQAVYLPQRPAVFAGTVEDNLRMPLELKIHRGHVFCRESIVSLLAHVQRTESFLERSSRDLSGGEIQIVALVRAIQFHPRLLLLDEPTGALDEESTRVIERIVSDWYQESPAHRAFVWVSHNREQVDRMANRVVAMEGGRLSARANE